MNSFVVVQRFVYRNGFRVREDHRITTEGGECKENATKAQVASDGTSCRWYCSTEVVLGGAVRHVWRLDKDGTAQVNSTTRDFLEFNDRRGRIVLDGDYR
jgi:hypothetical protein